MTSIIELVELPIAERVVPALDVQEAGPSKITPSDVSPDNNLTVLPALTKYGVQEPIEVNTGPPVPEPSVESTALRCTRLGSSFFAFFLAGWNVGATGALLPYIEQAFDIGYARVSVLFIATFIGYLAAAPTTGMIVRKLGYGRAYCLASTIVLIGNFINCVQHTNFNLMCFGYFIVGNGFANQLGIGYAYFAILRRPLLYMGFLHGTFSLGAFASPLVATVMTSHDHPFNYFYFTSLAMNIPALVFIWVAFRKLTKLPVQPDEISLGPQTALSVLKMRPVWTIAIFLLLYVGAEDSIGGWIVTYVRNVRHGTPTAASWVSSSFYLGLAIGRVTLPSLNVLLGERHAVFIYLLVALALEAVAWAVPAVASTAISTALVGLAISTFYMGAITIGGRLLPRSVHVDAFALMSSIGQSGSALFPLLVGLMSSKKGIWIVEPTMIALLGAQGACWYLVPKVEKRED